MSVLSSGCTLTSKVSSILRKAPRTRPGGSFMHSVMLTGHPLYAGLPPRGQGEGAEQVKQGHCPLRAQVLGGGTDSKKGNR